MGIFFDPNQEYICASTMESRLLLNHQALEHTLNRLAFELFEKHGDFQNTAIIALQPRGVLLGRRIVERIAELTGVNVPYGELDVTFYRDDFRRREEPLVPAKTNLDFSIEGKRIILVDDVLYTGRTVRSGMDAMLDFGRPIQVELMALIDRRFSRELPVQPDYIGRMVDVVKHETVKVHWSEDNSDNKVTLYSSANNE
jgi:pyrimidine operon attenuation protein / uracil phosphoribosyltransferase